MEHHPLKEGRIKETWANWLTAKTGYSNVHARKLRAVASILSGYPKFFAISLPFCFIYSKLKEIKNIQELCNYCVFVNVRVSAEKGLRSESTPESCFALLF